MDPFIAITAVCNAIAAVCNLEIAKMSAMSPEQRQAYLDVIVKTGTNFQGFFDLLKSLFDKAFHITPTTPAT